jgi:hypothetical protein
MAYSSLAKRIDNLEQRLTIAQVPDIIAGDDNQIFITATQRKYLPSATGKLFHDSTKMVRAIKGPVGSGKSTICCNQLMLRAASDLTLCKDGVRRYKALIIRNTYAELVSTTIETFMRWFGCLGEISYGRLIKYKAMIRDDKGLIEFSALFIPLDKEKQVEKLGSLEVTDAYINEARGLPGEKKSIIVTTIVDRCGRYPDKDTLQNPKAFKKNIYLDTNPPDENHWLYNMFEVEKNDDCEIFHQPSGLIKLADGTYKTNPDAENLEFLEEDYYVKGTFGKSEEHIRVQQMGHYGSYMEGDPIYPMYNDDLHSVEKLDFIHGLEVVLAGAFGCTPHVFFMQQDALGIVHVIKELYDDNSDVETFARDIVRPWIDKNLIGFSAISVGDPSGNARGNTALTALGILKRELSMKAVQAHSNIPATRIGAVQYFLGRLISGRPAYVISRTGCPRLRKGFIGGYCWKTVSGEKVPNKDNIYSHGHDANQYGCLQFRPPVTEKSNKEEYRPRLISAGLS